MTKQHRKKVLLAGLVAALSAGLVSLTRAADPKGAEAPTRELTLVNIKYQGKVLWLPSPIIVKKGEKVKLTLINNVPDDPAVHGFNIPEFNVKAEVARDTPATLEFTADKAGLFDTNCHLHPGHVHGELLVLEK